ncbi:MAG TPA: nuclear transport factor 2 family protein [Thermoanaerobaculia bacterium]|jgi:hypothetical protein
MRKLAIVAAFLTAACTSTAPPARTALYDEIARVDREMFDAFNAHDAAKLASYFDERLEFYHDTGGLLTLSDAMGGMTSNFAKNDGLRRELVPGSLEVYPIRDYGAIQVGAHRFCHVEDGRNDCGTFRFLHVWQKQERGWRITRAVSYDH